MSLGALIAAALASCTGEIGEILTTPPPPDRGQDTSDYWAFSVPVRPEPPAVQAKDWPRQPLDRFILAGIEKAGLAPTVEADRRALIRRASFDIRGLPPTPPEIDAFLSDPSADAYDRLIDTFLADPAYGEHRAHYWLDVARYADTHGFHLDNYRSIWPYRDYVIHAFNANMPFDQFTVEQLAGDLLAQPTIDQQVATAFGRCAMSTGEGGAIEGEFAAIAAKDRVETVAAAFLGLTLGCATCHDHKFDPIKQQEFYEMTAFFRNTTQAVFDNNEIAPAPVVKVGADMTPCVVTAERAEAPYAYVLKRGQYAQQGERVTPNVPRVLPPLPEGEPANRLGLAKWLVAPNHPLTARVAINRLWAEVFGTGIVATPENFGVTGSAPSNQPLLDWLAVEFRESGWDVKHMFKLMLTSAAYRQASTHTAAGDAIDPENHLLSRGPRFRMDAEEVRDTALRASGLLVSTMGGPPVKPYQPAGLWEAVAIDQSNTASYVQDHGDALFRRSVYTFWKRAAPPPSLELFNAPSRESTVVRRERTNTPLQALVLMDDPQFLEAARHLAANALHAASTEEARLDHMSIRLLARPLDETELQILHGSLAKVLTYYQTHPEDAASLLHVGDTGVDAALDVPTHAAWMVVASELMTLDETLER